MNLRSCAENFVGCGKGCRTCFPKCNEWEAIGGLSAGV